MNSEINALYKSFNEMKKNVSDFEDKIKNIMTMESKNAKINLKNEKMASPFEKHIVDNSEIYIPSNMIPMMTFDDALKTVKLDKIHLKSYDYSITDTRDDYRFAALVYAIKNVSIEDVFKRLQALIVIWTHQLLTHRNSSAGVYTDRLIKDYNKLHEHVKTLNKTVSNNVPHSVVPKTDIPTTSAAPVTLTKRHDTPITLNLKSYGYKAFIDNDFERKATLITAVINTNLDTVIHTLKFKISLLKPFSTPSTCPTLHETNSQIIKHMERDIEALTEFYKDKSSTKSDEKPIHLTTYGYHISEPVQKKRINALKKAVMNTSKKAVMNRISELQTIWKARANQAGYPSVTSAVTAKEYLKRLDLDYDEIIIM